ncbi:hypothetical protein [Salibacterium aidingense]|uniref:hypothetical protein n=1 Tax=Salibacterium aidingense TaxID=384933 RepID=UPI003BCB4893
MKKTGWRFWQERVIQEEYTKPEIAENHRRKKMEQINRKYQGFYLPKISRK